MTSICVNLKDLGVDRGYFDVNLREFGVFWRNFSKFDIPICVNCAYCDVNFRKFDIPICVNCAYYDLNLAFFCVDHAQICVKLIFGSSPLGGY